MTPLKLFPRQMTVIKLSMDTDYNKYLGEFTFSDGSRELIGKPIYRVVVLPRSNVKRARLVASIKNKPRGCFTTLDKIGMVTIIISMIECVALMAIDLNVGIVVFLSYMAFIILTPPKNEVCGCQ